MQKIYGRKIYSCSAPLAPNYTNRISSEKMAQEVWNIKLVWKSQLWFKLCADQVQLYCVTDLKSKGKNFLDTCIYLTDFLKTNLTKFVVIWVKRRQQAGFLSPRSSNITVTKEDERRKRKSEEKERRRREKSNGCTLSFCNSYCGDSFSPKKLLDAKTPFRDNVFKSPARYIDEFLKTLPPNRSFPLGSFFRRSKMSPE